MVAVVVFGFSGMRCQPLRRALSASRSVMELLTSENYFSELSKLFDNSLELDLAVAFLGYEVLSLFESSSCQNIRLLCNFQSGACNPYLVEKLLKLSKVQMKTNARLHAKVALQGTTAIVGSANLSANGLSLEGSEQTAWKELGVKFSNNETVTNIRAWFMEQWKESTTITSDDLPMQFENWKKRRKNRPLHHRKLSIIDAALYHQDVISDRDIYFVVYREFSSQEADIAFEQVSEESNDVSGTLNYFEDWLDLPDDAYLVSLRLGARGGVYFEGLQYMPSKPITKTFTKSDGSEGSIKICSTVNNILGFRFTNSDKKLIKQYLSHITNKGPIVPLTDWAESVNKGT